MSLAAAVEHLGVPVFANGLGRGSLPADHELAFLRTRGLLRQEADLVVVVGTPLDFRLGFGRFGSANVAHIVDAESQRAAHVDAVTVAGDLDAVLRGLAEVGAPGRGHEPWIEELRAAEDAARQAELPLLAAGADPIKPTRVYGELRRRLERDAVVICDGGDFGRTRASTSKCSHRGAGWTLDPMGVSETGWDTPSPLGWPGRTRRWWPCSGTGPPDSA